jgi:hypothetical protein
MFVSSVFRLVKYICIVNNKLYNYKRTSYGLTKMCVKSQIRLSKDTCVQFGVFFVDDLRNYVDTVQPLFLVLQSGLLETVLYIPLNMCLKCTFLQNMLQVPSILGMHAAYRKMPLG